MDNFEENGLLHLIDAYMTTGEKQKAMDALLEYKKHILIKFANITIEWLDDYKFSSIFSNIRDIIMDDRNGL